MTSAETCPLGPYIDAPPADLQPSLDRDSSAEVAIIGGGYTGLAAALRLREHGVDTVLLERDFCGYGASGRNAGHLTPTISKDIPTAVMMFGESAAGELVKFADHCVRNTERVMTQYQIDCDYHPGGNVMAVVHPSQEQRLRRGTAVAQKVGADVEFLEHGQMRDRGLPDAFLCGALEKAGGTFNPGKYVLGLRRAALRAGTRVHESTPVTGIGGGKRPVVATARGTVTADKVLIATNAFTPDLVRSPGSRIVPLCVSAVETAPLSPSQRALLGWPNREGIYTAHESLESFRISAQGTLIAASKGVRYFYGGRIGDPHIHRDNSCHLVEQSIADRFPDLGDLSIDKHWTGWIGMTLNFLPIIGQDHSNPAVYHAVGYNGHGVAQATTVGAMLADNMLDRRDAALDLVSRRGIWLPPEPFKWLGIRAILAVINGIDRRVDRKLRHVSQR